MATNQRNDSPPPMPALPFLCTEHLRHEASVLASALQLLHALEADLRLPDGNGVALAFRRHAELAALIDDLQHQRTQFRAASARLLCAAPESITLGRVVDRLPEQDRSVLLNDLTRVRQMANELAANNRRVSIFVRVHLDAYQRILCDLTNSGRGSGRYGAAGNAESQEYRPLIQIHG